MTNVFIINGYGVPKDIFNDDNYHFYLNAVFNQIWDVIASKQIIRKETRSSKYADDLVPRVFIFFCGGRTDCFSPHRRTEAGVMKKYFSMLMKRQEVRRAARSWRLIEEKKSLSTLENFLNAKDILKGLRITKGKITIFHEWTRRQRVKRTAKLILTDFNVSYVAIDFDVSANRYLPNTLWAKFGMKPSTPYNV